MSLLDRVSKSRSQKTGHGLFRAGLVNVCKKYRMSRNPWRLATLLLAQGVTCRPAARYGSWIRKYFVSAVKRPSTDYSEITPLLEEPEFETEPHNITQAQMYEVSLSAGARETPSWSHLTAILVLAGLLLI